MVTVNGAEVALLGGGADIHEVGTFSKNYVALGAVTVMVAIPVGMVAPGERVTLRYFNREAGAFVTNISPFQDLYGRPQLEVTLTLDGDWTLDDGEAD